MAERHYIVAKSQHDFGRAKKQLGLTQGMVWVYKHDLIRGLSNHTPVYVVGRIEDYHFCEHLIRDDNNGYIQIFSFELETLQAHPLDLENEVALLHLIRTYHNLLIQDLKHRGILAFWWGKVEEQEAIMDYLKDQIRIADGY